LRYSTNHPGTLSQKIGGGADRQQHACGFPGAACHAFSRRIRSLAFLWLLNAKVFHQSLNAFAATKRRIYGWKTQQF
jgi:hypothetical protein